MRTELTSGEDATNDVSSPYGAPRHGTDEPVEEKRLYGEPCHEVGGSTDEEQFYGDPQHDDGDFCENRGSGSVISAASTGELTQPTRPADRTASWSKRTVSKQL